MNILGFGRLLGRFAPALLATCLLAACVSDQIHSTAHHADLSLEPGDLEAHGLAFITPSTVTGQEEDKQTLAFVFADVMGTTRPDIRVVPLPQTLSAVNRAGIAQDYKLMYVDYRDTGIFKQDLLREVGQVTGARYLAQLKLSDFNQGAKSRFSVLGLRLIQTQQANIRLFFQVWNAIDGSIAWEGTQEVTYTWDSSSEKPVTFRLIVEEAARELISKLP